MTDITEMGMTRAVWDAFDQSTLPNGRKIFVEEPDGGLSIFLRHDNVTLGNQAGGENDIVYPSALHLAESLETPRADGDIWAGDLRFTQVAADEELTTAGGAPLILNKDTVRKGRVPIIIGDGTTVGTNFTISESGVYDFKQLDVTHRARHAEGQAHLITIEDVDDVSIIYLKVDGESLTRNGITLRGVVRNVKIDGGIFTNLRNFSIQFADVETDPTLSYFDGLTVENIRVSGAVGATGAGSGLNFFPRTQNGNVPASKNVWLHNNYIDVSQDEPDNANHGPQAYKFNNIIRLRGGYNYGRGGDIQCFSITNGCQDVDFDFIDMAFSNRGVQIDTDGNVATTVTNDVRIRRVKYRHEDVIGEQIGVYISGNVANIDIKEIDTDGNVSIVSNGPNETLNNLSLGDITLSGGAVFSVVSAVTTLPITDARIGPINSRDNGGAATVNLGTANRAFINAVVRPVTSVSSNGSVVQNYGQNNRFEGIYAVNCNLSDVPNSAALIDFGDDTAVDFISIQGGANGLDFFVRKRAGSGFTINQVIGTPVDAFGFAFENQENSKLPIGNIRMESPRIDLAAAAQTDVQFFTASKTTYILGIRLVFPDGTSADAMKAVRLRRNSTNIVNHVTASNRAAGDFENFTNTTGVNASAPAQRKLEAGDRLTYSTAGSGTGAGTATWIVTMVEAI